MRSDEGQALAALIAAVSGLVLAGLSTFGLVSTVGSQPTEAINAPLVTYNSP